MNIRKKTVALTLCLSFAASLMACQKPGVPEEQTGQEAEEFARQTEPDHFYEEVEEGLLVDAAVDRPEGNVTPKIYMARRPDFSKESLYAFLDYIGDPVEEVRVDFTEDQVYNFDGVCASGGHAIALVGLSAEYSGGSISYNRLDADRWYSAMLCEGDTRQYVDPTGSDDNTNLFSEPQDFSFATEEEALAAVKKALALLDVDVGSLELQRTLYLSHEALAIAERSQLVQEKNGVKGEEIVKEAWTEDDDGYMFTFNCGQDGIPMLESGWYGQTEQYVPVTIWVRYNRQGITNLVLQGALNFEEVVEEPPSIVPASEALALAKEITQSVVSSYDRVIDGISLRYYSRQDGDRWLLTPCWEVAVCQKGVKLSEDVVSDVYTYIVIDALTGVEK